MKKIMFLAVLLCLAAFSGCASADVSVDLEEVFFVDVVDGEDVYQMSCSVGLKTGDGVILDTKCKGFVETDTGTYKCSVEVGSEGKPVAEKITIKQNCKLEIKKDL